MTAGATTLHLLCAGAARGLVGALEPRFAHETGATLVGRYGAVGAMKEALAQRFHQALDGAGTEQLQGARRHRLAVRAHCSGFAPEILTMFAHLAMSAWI